MNNNSIPIFRIFDEAKAREFYLDYLGFEVTFEHRYEENTPLYIGITRQGCEIHLSEHVETQLQAQQFEFLKRT